MYIHLCRVVWHTLLHRDVVSGVVVVVFRRLEPKYLSTAKSTLYSVIQTCHKLGWWKFLVSSPNLGPALPLIVFPVSYLDSDTVDKFASGLMQ